MQSHRKFYTQARTASVEVEVNQGEAIVWSLLKPVLASELNLAQREIQTGVGIVITATESLG